MKLEDLEKQIRTFDRQILETEKKLRELRAKRNPLACALNVVYSYSGQQERMKNIKRPTKIALIFQTIEQAGLNGIEAKELFEKLQGRVVVGSQKTLIARLVEKGQIVHLNGRYYAQKVGV